MPPLLHPLLTPVRTHDWVSLYDPRPPLFPTLGPLLLLGLLSITN